MDSGSCLILLLSILTYVVAAENETLFAAFPTGYRASKSEIKLEEWKTSEDVVPINLDNMHKDSAGKIINFTNKYAGLMVVTSLIIFFIIGICFCLYRCAWNNLRSSRRHSRLPTAEDKNYQIEEEV